MRRNLIRVGLVILLIVFGFVLYNVGKEHKIFIDNRDITISGKEYTATMTYRVYVDDKQVGDVRKGKRKVAKSPGSKHTIIIEELDGRSPTGQKWEYEFRLKAKQAEVIVNIPALLGGAEKWLENKED